VSTAGTAVPRLLRPTAVGFALGSLAFAVGVPLSLDTALNPAVAGWTFFLGSVLFTSAATLQFLMSAAELPELELATERRWARLSRPRTTDWTASAIQLVGTLAFNLTTVRAALDAAGTGSATAQMVWRPDAIGSVLFLVSSAIALAPEVRRRRHGHVRDRSWAIAALNMLGSVFFGLSAIGAYVSPTTEDLLSMRWSNGGTLLGALCFLAGALLLLPRRRVTPSSLSDDSVR
jgi:hypothetical protein